MTSHHQAAGEVGTESSHVEQNMINIPPDRRPLFHNRFPLTKKSLCSASIHDKMSDLRLARGARRRSNVRAEPDHGDRQMTFYTLFKLV
jgi:hypothetical protein